MTSAWMLTLVLVGPPSGQLLARDVPLSAADLSPIQPQASVKVRSRDALRDAYRRAMQKSANRANPEPEEVVPELSRLYAELAGAEDMSRSEKRRLRRGVGLRLVQMRDKLLRGISRRSREAGREKAEASTCGTGRNDRQLAGGGADARALELIELIQTTIAPESWDVNGGRGSIRYYAPLHVLVVRQTGEVHHQLGGVLDALRR